MEKRYLLYVQLPYAYSVLRPLEQEIWRRGGEAAWYVERGCPVELTDNEQQMPTLRAAIAYRPLAVFAPGNYIPDFLPGVKVDLFHGYNINKRVGTMNHFKIRGWFDIYCTQGPSSTPHFKELEQQLGFFRVYETGWPKADTYFSPAMQTLPRNPRPRIIYSTTFTHGITSAPILLPEIERLAETKAWDWTIIFHPKLQDPTLRSAYRHLAATHANVTFYEGNDNVPLLQQADAMLCDTSSIILEFMFLNKPVVTFRNTSPGNHLINVQQLHDIEPALERALMRPADLMSEIQRFTMHHEPHRDGRCSARVLDAVDDFLAASNNTHATGYKPLKRKPLNLIRKLKLRLSLRFFSFRGLLR